MDNSAQKETIVSLASLYQQYINASVQATNKSNTSDMTDEEMLFSIELTKVEDVLSNDPHSFDNVQRFINIILLKLHKLKDVFKATKASDVFDENSPEWVAFKNALNKLDIASLSFIGLSIVGHTLLFVLRVSRRVIYKYRVQNALNQHVDSKGLLQSLNDVFTYGAGILTDIPKIDKAAKYKFKDIVEKAQANEMISKDPSVYLQKFLQEVDTMNDKKNKKVNVQTLQKLLPSTVVNNVGMDETMMLLEKQFSIEDIFDSSSKGWQAAVSSIKHLQHNIQQRYQNLFNDNEANDLFDEDKWLNLKTQIQSVDVSKLSYSNLTVVGNVLLFLWRTTRKIIVKYRLRLIKSEPSTSVDIDAKRDLHQLWLYTTNTLSNLHVFNSTTHRVTKKMIKQAHEYDNKLLDAVLQDIPRNLSNFQSLAANMLSLFNIFNTTTDAERKLKIAAAKTKGKIYLDRVHLADAAKFINMYLDSSYQIPISTKTDYEYLQQFLTAIKDLKLAEKIRGKIDKPDDVVHVLHQMKLLLYPSSNLYFRCLELYEFLSGTIRIIVRRKYQNTASTQKEQLYPGYDIKLDHTNNTIQFQDVDAVYKTYFNNTSLIKGGKVNNMFGPFYDIFPNNKSDEASKVAADIVKDALQLDTLITMVTEHSASIVLYSYGYSGSGKTFNFFGEISTLNVGGSYDEGLIWRLFRSLSEKEGVKVQLVKRIKLYGVLEPYMQTKDGVEELQKGMFCFKDNITVLAFKSTQNEENWATTINKDLEVTHNNKLGFSKSTSNNKASSRGFYILKFEVSYKDKKSYIGVVDMAGNEDPYDIANAMIPTLDMSKFQNFLEGDVIASVYDVVYQEVHKVISNIIIIILLCILLINKLNYFPDALKEPIGIVKGKPKKINNDKQITRQLSFLPVVYSKLQKIITTTSVNQKLALDNNESIDNIPLLKNTTLQNAKLLVLDPKLCVARWNKDKLELKFIVKEDLIIKILKSKTEALESELGKELENNKNKSVADISANLKTIESNSSQEHTLQKVLLHKKLKLAHDELTKAGDHWNDVDITINANIKNLNIPQNIDQNLFQNFALYGNEAHKKEINKINTTISGYFCDRKYILPVSNDVKVNYHYSQLCQIVKEGYYINKANAELIHFFQRKRNYQDPVIDVSRSVKDTTENILQGNSQQNTLLQNTTKTACIKHSSSIKQPNKDVTAYNYEGNFDFKNYNKFAVQFPPKPTDDVKHYDTSLVKTLLSEFGDDNVRHIMFACVRDDKETDKIVGAISTLYLVQDLKST